MPLPIDRLHEKARAARWGVEPERFAAALERSARSRFGDHQPDERELTRYFESLRLEDLALACACEAGREAAWDHFVREMRPKLYAAAHAIAAEGGRELADSLYADLYGIDAAQPDRRSLFRHFHGRSSLLTWLRAVLARRHVDAIRASRRSAPLDAPDLLELSGRADPPPEDRLENRRTAPVVRAALRRTLEALEPRQRLRLAYYYLEALTLAQVGRLLGESEATVSRQLARTRREVRDRVLESLRREHGLTDADVAAALDALQDRGDLELKPALERSTAAAMKLD